MKPTLAILLVSAPLAALVACVADASPTGPSSAELLFALDPGTSESLAEVPAVRDELAQVMYDYFGLPTAPRLRVLDSWRALGFDPNGSPLEGARPPSDFEGAPPEAILVDNQRYWASELAALNASTTPLLGPWRRRGVMNAAWSDLAARRGAVGEGEWRVEARAFFAERYPDLSEAAQMFLPNCARCHGREGGGDGPMAAGLYPKPRNYQRGVFKFAAVEGGSKPRRIDLMRTVVQGLPGSAMPSFRTTSLAEISALVDYVRYLSIRGEVEAMLVAEWENDDVPPREAIAELYELVWSRWLEAADNAQRVTAPAPDPSPERLALGEAVFHDEQRGNCFSCHEPTGKGDGRAAVQIGEDGERYVLLKDEWGDFILPRDLTSGVFRGGARREDVYLRIHCGIPGTPMPSFGASVDAAGEPLLSEDEKWALVDYVLSLSNQGPFAQADSR